MASRFLLDENTAAWILEQIRAAPDGRVAWTVEVEHLLGRALVPLGAEFLAALTPWGPIHRRADGQYDLTALPASRCWPARAQESLDRNFALDEVRFNPATGAWCDANGAQDGLAWGAAVAARVWRRPQDRVTPMEAGQRILAIIGLGLLRQRAAEIDGEPWPGLGGPKGPCLPVVASPPLAPEPPCAEGVEEHTTPDPEEAIAAAVEARISGDDVRLLAALCQHFAPIVRDAAGSSCSDNAAVAELAVAVDRIANFLIADRADRLASLLDESVLRAERGSEARALARAHRSRRHGGAGPIY